MNETERRKLWFEARAALRLGGDYPDWPDRLALPVIARLHDPVASRGMLDFLNAKADAGTLPTETHEFQTARPGRRATTSAHLTGRSVVIAQQPIIETRRVRNAHVADVAADFGASDVGRFLAAWIAPYRQQLDISEVASPAPSRALTRMKLDKIKKTLPARYLNVLENALRHPCEKLEACRPPDRKHGHYYLEMIEDLCRDMAGEVSAANSNPFSISAQVQPIRAGQSR